MRGSHICLSILVVFAFGIAAGIGHFHWKNNRPLPSVGQIEGCFEKEIRTLDTLAGQIDIGVLLYRPHLALPKGAIESTREQLSDSALLSASIKFTHPGSINNIYVVHDDSLNLWSPNSSQNRKGSYVTFCYSGLRQLIRYERITQIDTNQTVGFEIVFSPEVLAQEG